MLWQYWFDRYLGTFCVARGLASSSIASYKFTLESFHDFIRFRADDKEPNKIKVVDVLKYLEYLKTVRLNSDSTAQHQSVVIRSFYRAMVSMDYLDASDNPMAHFPSMKSGRKKVPVSLSLEEVKKLIDAPDTDTVIGIRDRALAMLFYGTGIRRNECAGLREKDVDFENRIIRVLGKGNIERVVPMNESVIAAMKRYRAVRISIIGDAAFFRSRGGGALSRSSIYDRIKIHSIRAGIEKNVSPHTLRHTFATHLVKEGVDIVTISKLLGHKLVTSTQVYIHLTGEDLRDASDAHPIKDFADTFEKLIPGIRIPFQRSRKRVYE